MIRVIDNFLPNWRELRDVLDNVRYADVVNPVDSVVYPGITTEIPQQVVAEIHKRLSAIHSEAVDLRTTFARLSHKGVEAPHQAHTDSSMGQYSFMLYMNRQEHAQGGTSLVRHKATGMDTDLNLSEAGHKIWLRDTNKTDAWSITKMVAMQPNRAFIFPSYMMHRAEPVTGFGHTAKNGRLVLTVFYNILGE